MSKPYKCPVCDGAGLVSRPPHIPGDVTEWTDSKTGPYECRACKGFGIVLVKNSNNDCEWGDRSSNEDPLHLLAFGSLCPLKTDE